MLLFFLRFLLRKCQALFWWSYGRGCVSCFSVGGAGRGLGQSLFVLPLGCANERTANKNTKSLERLWEEKARCFCTMGVGRRWEEDRCMSHRRWLLNPAAETIPTA